MCIFDPELTAQRDDTFSNLKSLLNAWEHDAELNSRCFDYASFYTLLLFMSTTFQAPIDGHPPNVAPRESSPNPCLTATILNVSA